MFRKLFRSIIDHIFTPYEHRLINSLQQQAKTSPDTKIAQRHLYHYYRNLLATGSVPKLAETGFRCFSQFEEDGKLLFIFAALGISSGTFVDIGAADGINSNCANFALNFGWQGVFIDGNADKINRGKDFYRKHPDSWAYPPRFVQALVTRENINDILRMSTVPSDVDLLSVDIDGNDYWVWDAIECVRPKVAEVLLCHMTRTTFTRASTPITMALPPRQW
jgi:hypothetical protein